MRRIIAFLVCALFLAGFSDAELVITKKKLEFNAGDYVKYEIMGNHTGTGTMTFRQERANRLTFFFVFVTGGPTYLLFFSSIVIVSRNRLLTYILSRRNFHVANGIRFFFQIRFGSITLTRHNGHLPAAADRSGIPTCWRVRSLWGRSSVSAVFGAGPTVR